ncbi:terminase large subunit [Novosphingobium olei]|uniref:terminase large subunit n=1 Tax=Novosphingobium olei TaxID=2728851 RepID=UPI00308769EA|nr:terminase large subunit [Novosphingobium olei]
MTWSTACPDWEERIVEGRSLVPFAPLFPDEAEAALGVFKRLQMTDLPAKEDGTWPTLGEVCEEFVFDFVRAVFGSYDHKRGRRLIRDFLLLIAKKNGKSTIAAGIMLTALIRNWRHQSELLVLAPTMEVANNSFGPAKGMIEADPELAKLFHVIENQRLIRHRVTQAELKIVAADSGVVSGKKAAFVLVDELWLFGKQAKAKGMLREATGGLVSRKEGFVIYLTTHSDEPPAGVFKEKLEYFRSVRDGDVADNTSFGMLFEWPEKMIEEEAYLDPANWYVTNPNLGKSVDEEWLASELTKEKTGEGEGLQIFLAKHLNVEIGLRLRRDRWRGADHWEAAGDPALASLDTLLDRCEVVTAGVDGGGEDDLLGLCVAGRERMTQRWLFWHHAWAWPDVLDRRKDIVSVLRGFEEAGDLTICDEDSRLDAAVLAEAMAKGEAIEVPLPQDMAELAGYLARVKDRGLFPAENGVAVDRVGSPMLVDAMASIGIVPPLLVGQGQGWMLNGVIAALPRMLKDGRALHGGRPMMAWAVSNAKVTYSGSALVMTKQAAGSMKIDPVIAMLNAASCLARGPVAADKPKVLQVFV